MNRSNHLQFKMLAEQAALDDYDALAAFGLQLVKKARAAIEVEAAHGTYHFTELQLTARQSPDIHEAIEIMLLVEVAYT